MTPTPGTVQYDAYVSGRADGESGGPRREYLRRATPRTIFIAAWYDRGYDEARASAQMTYSHEE